MSDEKAHEVAVAYEQWKAKRARELFPTARSGGEALSKYFETAEGQQALTVGLAYDYQKAQKTNALGNAYEITKAQPEVSFDDNSDDDSEPFDQKIARLMRDKGLSYDQAATVLHRREQAQKIADTNRPDPQRSVTALRTEIA